MGDGEKILGHSSRLLGSDLHLEGMLWAEPQRGSERGGQQSQGRTWPCVAGGHSDTMISHCVVNHFRATAEVWSTRHHHGTAPWDGGQAPTK